jgi:hypothetical protein
MTNAVQTSSMTAPYRAAQALGYFSIALGAAEILFPSAIARALGLEGKENWIRFCGVREIGAGLAAMTPNPAPAIWSRVGGDVVDMATLTAGVKADDPRQRRNAEAALSAVALITAIDVVVAAMLSVHKARPANVRDYSDRSGLPRCVEASRGLAADGAQNVRAIGADGALQADT